MWSNRNKARFERDLCGPDRSIKRIPADSHNMQDRWPSLLRNCPSPFRLLEQKYHRLVTVKQQKFLTFLEAGESEINVQSDSASGESRLPGSLRAVISLCPLTKRARWLSGVSIFNYFFLMGPGSRVWPPKAPVCDRTRFSPAQTQDGPHGAWTLSQRHAPVTVYARTPALTQALLACRRGPALANQLIFLEPELSRTAPLMRRLKWWLPSDSFWRSCPYGPWGLSRNHDFQFSPLGSVYKTTNPIHGSNTLMT